MPVLKSLRLIGSGGANRAMEAEVKRLAPRALGGGWSREAPRRADEQTLVYDFDPRLARLFAGYLRTPSRVLWDLFEAKARRLEPLYDELLEWIVNGDHLWLEPGLGVSVRATRVQDFPAGELQIQGTVKNALIEGAARRAKPVGGLHLRAEDPDILFSVRGDRDRLLISIDLAGRSLHERGWRIEAGEAPLRETLAAQMLLLSRWDTRSEALLDPTAGAGTIPIEGVLMSRGAPLWAGAKRPLLERIEPFKSGAGGDAAADLFPNARAIVIMNELDTGTVDVARRNASRAGADGWILSLHGDLRDLTPGRLAREADERRPPRWPAVESEPVVASLERGLLIANPPYGERIGARGAGSKTIAELYEALRDLWKSLGPGWRLALLIEDPELARIFGPRPALEKPMANGPLKTRLYVFEPGGSRVTRK